MIEPTPDSPNSQAARYVPRFFMRQQITLMVNRYELYAANSDGTEGPLLALAQQKRMAFKEEVTFYGDAARTRPEFSFKARKAIDLASAYDVFDASGNTLGGFQKVFGASLLRSTWRLSGADLEARGQERDPTIAILRRVWDFIPILGEVWVPFVFHFDFIDETTGNVVLRSHRKKSIRDRYTIEVPDERLDFRIAAALAVALDALQSR